VEKIKVRNFDANEREVVRAYKQILRSILTKVFKDKEIRPGTVKNISPQEASKYITSQEYSDLIHHIVYYLDNDLLKKVEIIDTPGLGSSDYTHTLRTQSFIKEANFAILLVEAEKPMQNESEIKFSDLLEKEGKINQLIVIVNKVDRSEKDIQTIKHLMKKELADTFEGDIEIPDERIFFLSSEYFFLKQNPDKNQEKLKALENHKNVDPNALDKFEYYYKTSLTKEKDKILLEDSKVVAVLVNIFGGIVRCDRVARGIINAVQNVALDRPLVVRLIGTNSEEGNQLLADSGLSLETATGMAEAAQKVISKVARR
jgi:signal recognition particle receptor subunit beta